MAYLIHPTPKTEEALSTIPQGLRTKFVNLACQLAMAIHKQQETTEITDKIEALFTLYE